MAKKTKKLKKKTKTKKIKTGARVLITKNMTIGQIIQKYPNTAEVFFRHGFYCIGCQAAAFESLEQGAKAHGMSDSVVKQMVKELNKAAKESNNNSKINKYHK